MSQSGGVDAAQKISNSDGNFPYTLAGGDDFGKSVAAIGDLDGDGVADLAVGAQGDDDGDTRAGAVHILFMDYSGTVLSTQKISNSYGGMSGELIKNGRFGASLAAIGDANGDGTVDLAVGARGGSADAGALFVLFMNTDGTVGSALEISNSGNLPFTLNDRYASGDADNGDRFGSSVTAIGDLNGDGIIDLAVGAPGFDVPSGCSSYFGLTTCAGGLDRGAVHVLFMREDGTVSSYNTIAEDADLAPYNLHADDYFGWSAAALGDISGDGLVDLAVGASPYDDDHTNAAGAVYVLALDADGSALWVQKIASDYGSLPFTLQNGDWFGVSLAAADLNGDGLTDLIVGARGTESAAGIIYVLNLRSLCPSPVPTAWPSVSAAPTLQPSRAPTPQPSASFDPTLQPTTLPSPQPSASFDPTPQPTTLPTPQPSTSPAPTATPQPTNRATQTSACVSDGTITSHHEFSGENTGSLPFTLDNGDRFGDAVAAIDDLNGDGVADLVVGAYRDDDGGDRAGEPVYPAEDSRPGGVVCCTKKKRETK